MGRPGGINTIVHHLVGGYLQAGDVAVDATAGNGHDTVFLAQKVGEKGFVYAFDIQLQALDQTERRLKEVGLRERVHLIQAGHEEMDRYVEKRPVKAVMFNLGYLPGSDKKVITRPETTLKAVQAALNLLAPGGVVSIIVYTGHPGGEEESTALAALLSTLDSRDYAVLKGFYVNRSAKAPFFYLVEKTGGRGR